MGISYNDLVSMADQINDIYNQQMENIDTVESVGLHREVQKLSREWWMDFIIGMMLGYSI